MSVTREERDTLGPVRVPADALWGAQTQRALENFPISGQRFGRDFLAALGQVKRACAQSNLELGLLAPELAAAILQACDEVIAGTLDAHFPVDVFQTGSGTSTNMNANEVIANRAIQLLGGVVGSKTPVHPNDHVNLSQSSNDVIPTTIHVAATLALREALLPALMGLHAALLEKADAFEAIVKTGRTHLQDATPIRLGQEFGGYAAQVEGCLARLRVALQTLRPVALGGTAVGTGVNCPAGFAARAIAHLNAALDTDFCEAPNHMAANASQDALVEVSGQLKTLAVSLARIADDIRWLASGPRAGLGELRLPEVQPGSSIMPGKVNPVMAEALLMVTAQVIGFDSALTLGGLHSRFELNTMLPLMAHNLLQGITWLAHAVCAFTERCVTGLEADAERCYALVERNLALATALTPLIGYDAAASLAQEAYRSGRTIKEVAVERGVADPETLERLLDPLRLTANV
ncbi:MAG: class II fumarate hydratase [Chloroflexi bacterium]|nr:class II fumarate hydratase [Chloroflexota bacterium]HOC22131.1 class II fumarate hydratase [Anaerolineae bacterium]HQM15073.1 class II fumarate hydratase [Anaerolineae bacterium]